MQVALLGEGCRAEHAEVRLLPGVFHHVGLQHHLLVEGLAAVGALEGSLPFEGKRIKRWREMKRKRQMKEHGRKAAKSNSNRECYSEIVDSAHSMQRSIVKMLSVNVSLLTVLLLT